MEKSVEEILKQELISPPRIAFVSIIGLSWGNLLRR
tara:strand:- start:334 stop:441 length:108 start_codon:yes stop_codon:yes gene_type:complete